MKIFTKRFLLGREAGKNDKDYADYNKNKAQDKLGIPKYLYHELSAKVPESPMFNKLNKEMIFLAGFVIGWAERNKKIK